MLQDRNDEKSKMHSLLWWGYSDPWGVWSSPKKSREGLKQPRTGLRAGQVRASEIRQDIFSHYGHLPYSPLPKHPSATTCTSRELRKTSISNTFPCVWNNGQTARVNSEATLMGKVECWSETEKPQSQTTKQWKLWQAELSGSGKTLTNKFRFPSLEVLNIRRVDVLFFFFLTKEAEFSSPCPHFLVAVMLGLEPLGYILWLPHLMGLLLVNLRWQNHLPPQLKPGCSSHTNFVSLFPTESFIRLFSATDKS